MADSMRFSIIGDDRLSPVLNRAGDTAVTMAGRIQLAATEADLAMAGLTRDLEHQVRDAQGRVIPESEALGRAIGAHVRGGLDETLSGLHPEVQIDADSRPADEEVAALYRRMESLRDARIGVDIPVDDVLGEVDQIRTALDALGGTHTDPEVRVRADEAYRTLTAVRAEISRLDQDRATIDVDLNAARALTEAEAVHEAVRRIGDDDGPDRARSRFGVLGTVIGGVAGALGRVAAGSSRVALIGGAALQAVPLVASLITTVEQIGPAAAVATTGVAAIGLAAGTVKLGMSGVSDAVAAAFDPKKAKNYATALAGLAPPARSFVRELKALKPQLDALKLDVQSRLFSGLSGRLKDLSVSVLPLLRSQLKTTAGTLNTMALGVADTATALADSGVFGKALSGANKGLRNLIGIPGQVVNALGELAAAAAPSFVKLTAAASKAASGILGKLDTAFNSGAMQQAIETAVGLVGQLGHVLGNVGTIFKNVLGAAGTAGGNLVGVLGTVTSALAKATSLPGVQAALTDLFTVMNEIGKVAGPLLVQAFALVGPVITTLTPSVLRLVDSLGAGLQPIITALGPVLVVAAGAVGSLLDAVTPLLPVVGQMIASLGPVLTPILKVVGGLFVAVAPVLAQLGKSLLPPVAAFTKTLATAFQLLAPVLQTALTQLGAQGLTPIIQGLGTVLGQIVTQYSAAFLQMFQQLLPVVPQVTPVLIQLGTSLGQILTAVAPLVPQLGLMSVQFVSAVLPAILPLIPPLAQLTVLLLKLATGVITKVVIPVIGAMVKVMGGLRTALKPAIDAVEFVTKGIAGAFKWLYDILLGHSIIPDIVDGAVAWFAGLPGRAASALAGLAGRIGSKAAEAGTQLIGAIRRGIDGALSWIGRLPGMAAHALGDLSGVLVHAGRSLIGGFISGIKSMGSAAASAAGSILGKVKNFFPNSPAKEGPFSGRGWTRYSGQAVMDDWAAGMSSRQSGVVGAVTGVAAAAAGALPLQLNAGVGVHAGASMPAPARRGTGPIQITVPGAGGIVLAKEIQRALLELKRVSGLNISLEIG